MDATLSFPIAIITSLKTKVHSNLSIWPLVGSLWNWALMPGIEYFIWCWQCVRKDNSLHFPDCTILLPKGNCSNCQAWISIRFSSMSVILPRHTPFTIFFSQVCQISLVIFIAFLPNSSTSFIWHMNSFKSAQSVNITASVLKCMRQNLGNWLHFDLQFHLTTLAFPK